MTRLVTISEPSKAWRRDETPRKWAKSYRDAYSATFSPRRTTRSSGRSSNGFVAAMAIFIKNVLGASKNKRTVHRKQQQQQQQQGVREQ